MQMSSKTTGALGGTFDHFHKGHEHFLEFAAKQADRILIGVTNQSLIREKELSSIIEPYEVRTEAVRRFCESLPAGRQGKKINFEIVELADPFGPTLGQREVDCLILTELTVRGGQALNDRRKELGLAPLPTAVCSMLKDESGEILNSTRIRQGLVNREGIVYYQLFVKDYELKPTQKEFFKNPLGELVTDSEGKGTIVAVVGDICLSNFRKNNWEYQLGVFDKRSERQEVTDPEILSIRQDITAQNPAGAITAEVVQKLSEMLRSIDVLGESEPKHLFIDGEEDLVTAALILLLPLNSLIYYGQPGEGMVRVTVREEVKERIHALFSKNHPE